MRSGKVGWSRSRERGVRGSIDERKIEQRRIPVEVKFVRVKSRRSQEGFMNVHVADRQLRSALSKRMRGHLRRVQHLVLVRQARRRMETIRVGFGVDTGNGGLTFLFHLTRPDPAAPSLAPTSSPSFRAPPLPPTKCP